MEPTNNIHPSLNFNMAIRLNRILDDLQLTQILTTIFRNSPGVVVKRAIARTGRNQSSVPWVYLFNEITQRYTATFISFNDLLENFWLWMDTIELMATALFQRQAISEVIYQCLEEGDRVYSRLHGWAIVVLKERSESKRLPRIWLELEDRLEIVEPCYLCLN